MTSNRVEKAALMIALMAIFTSPMSPALADPTIYKGQVSVAPNAVHVAGEEVFNIQAPAGGFSAQERAIIVERNINNALAETPDRSPDSVQIVPINGLPVIRIGGKHVVTIDSRTAQLAGTSMLSVAQAWAGNLRTALADKVKVDTYLAELDGNFITTGVPYRRAQYEAARLNHAADQFAELTPIGLKSSLSFERLGMDAMMNRDYKASAENFKTSLEMDKGNAQSHYGLGVSYMKLGQVDAAIKELQMSRWLEPDNALTHVALGQAFETQGHDVDALKQFKEAILLQPDNPQPYLMVADLREARNDIGLSVAELGAALQRIPTSEYITVRRKDQLTWRLNRPM